MSITIDMHPKSSFVRMKSFPPAAVFLLCMTVLSTSLLHAHAANGIVLWDTLSTTNGNLESRGNWRAIPTDLLVLEKIPAKASSDPGYYGRDYAFKGDAVVENEKLLAFFSGEKGGMILYTKTTEPNTLTLPTPKKTAEIIPMRDKEATAHLGIIRNAGDEVVLEVSFEEAATGGSRAVFSFDKTDIVGIKPAKEMQGVRVLAPIEYCILPGFVGDDLIFGPAERSDSDSISLLSENVLLALINGENTALTMTWPKANQKIQLACGNEQNGKKWFRSINFENDGESFYLAALAAPGIWHKENLNASFLEKDVAIKWKKPFPAKWQTELLETGTKTRFGFSESKREIWRGVPGSYNYPVWFDGETAFYHLSKKVPPKGESV
ncbi:MAG: hypothetical protein JWM99_3377, partial [Verrucomicrobiales bacterium]|nr:hypothetical protein [Verrucomicrobiales bacterium]